MTDNVVHLSTYRAIFMLSGPGEHQVFLATKAGHLKLARKATFATRNAAYAHAARLAAEYDCRVLGVVSCGADEVVA